jgi:hypothetical protein
MPPAFRASTLAGALLLAGCASAPRAPDPRLEARLAGLQTLGVLVDVLRSETLGAGQLERVELDENRRLGRRLTDSLAAWLRGRGYPTPRLYPPAVGLFQSHAVQVVVHQPGGPPDGERRLPPLDVAPEVANDAALARTLNAAFAGSDEPVVDGPPVREAVAVLIARSRRVPLDSRVHADRELSETRVTLVVVDAATRRVVWNDRHRMMGAGDEVLFPLMERLVGRLPLRPPGVSP